MSWSGAWRRETLTTICLTTTSPTGWHTSRIIHLTTGPHTIVGAARHITGQRFQLGLFSDVRTEATTTTPTFTPTLHSTIRSSTLPTFRRGLLASLWLSIFALLRLQRLLPQRIL